MKNKEIVIVNYSFPPNEGIGGRRWAKLAKGLANEGYLVHVIAAESLNSEPSTWYNDVLHPNIKITYLPIKYPKVLIQYPKSLISKLEYKFWVVFLHYLVGGTIYDLTIFWRNQLQRKLIPFAKQETTIIVSGAPFNLMVHAAELKEMGFNFNLILDFRDPWIGAYNYGMPDLNSRRQRVELNKFNKVCKHADTIISPNKVLSNELYSFLTDDSIEKSKFKVLSHFYDKDDVVCTNSKPVQSNSFVFVYAGSLTKGIEKQLNNFNVQLSLIKENNPDIYRKLKVKFYTNELNHATIFNSHNNVFFIKPIGKKVYKEVALASGLLLFYTSHTQNYLTTKIFDYLPYKKKFLLFSEGGAVAEFLKERNLGYQITDSFTIIDFLNTFSKKESIISKSLDTTEFELTSKTKELIQYL